MFEIEIVGQFGKEEANYVRENQNIPNNVY